MKNDAIIKKFNIYCDESRVENMDSRFMVIGALFVPRDIQKSIAKEIKGIFSSFNFFQELKWNKVGGKYSDFNKKIIDYFISNEVLQYRCIIVDKSKVKYDVFHDNDKELAFFKFYYLMLRNRLADNNNYYIFLDKKPTRDKNRARSLRAYLDSYVLLRRKNCNIKHLQAYPSKENPLLQLTDFLTGSIGFDVNKNKDGCKAEIVRYLRLKLGKPKLSTSTPLSEQKFNIFVWNKDI